MDKRKKYYIVLDTETCPIDKTITEVDPTNMLVYNIGWIVTDRQGNVYLQKSYIVKDIFFKEKDKMQSAYYASKIPRYWEMYYRKEIKIAKMFDIRQELLKDISDWRVTEVYAHNAYFDCISLDTTQAWLTQSRYKYFFPKGIIRWCDTFKMACQTIGKQKAYQRFCKKNNYFTERGRQRHTAEILYRYISKQDDFIESHTALEDVLIEKEILRYCLKQHKKMNRFLFNNNN